MRKGRLRSAIMYACFGACMFLAGANVSYAKEDADKQLVKQEKEQQKQEKELAKQEKQGKWDPDDVIGEDIVDDFGYNALPMGRILISAGYGETFEVPTFSAIYPYVDQRVSIAFEKLGFTYKIDRSLPAYGTFSARDRYIIVSKGKIDHVLHELGHFLAFFRGNADNSKEWNDIYQAEKSKYDGKEKLYVTSSPSEYLGESFRDYCRVPAELKVKRPRTYAYIQQLIESINLGSDIQKYLMFYQIMWNRPN